MKTTIDIGSETLPPRLASIVFVPLNSAAQTASKLTCKRDTRAPFHCSKAAKRDLPRVNDWHSRGGETPELRVDQSSRSTDLNGTAVARLLLGAGGVAALGGLVAVLGLASRLLGLAAVLSLLQCGTGGSTDLRLLVALLADLRDTNDGTLDLGGLASTTASDLLNLLLRNQQ
ncbi:hypothetical protein GN244_ATG16857 [Phytophthora infestans]|uniref:Uncharacterized protein n=1 Tax=Phytophthora infestans TaxID=4787 RepID=A0A833S2J5_PHYIN|nr:hypothetical protein GN244_ATG16857 [Phytophthora infestans]